MATLVVSLCDVSVQELVLRHRHITQRHGLQNEAHYTSYHFFLFLITRSLQMTLIHSTENLIYVQKKYKFLLGITQ